jgi:hypothetical protein
VAKPDDVCAALRETRCKGKAFGMKGEWDESGFFVAVIPHEDGQPASRFERLGTVADE